MAQRALLVGLSTYKRPTYALPGVVQDLATMQPLVAAFGFADVHILKDDQATGPAVKQAMHDLVQGLGPGDTCLFYFSGHGVRKAPTGQTPMEWLLTYESRLSPSISTHWFRQFLHQVPVGVTWWGVYDACFSGNVYGSTSGPVPIAPDGVPVPKGAKLVPLSDFDDQDLHGADGAASSLAASKGAPSFDLSKLRLDPTGNPLAHLVVSDPILHSLQRIGRPSFHLGASQPDRIATIRVIHGAPRSVYTHALHKYASPGMSVKALDAQVSPAVKAHAAGQVPWLSVPPGMEHTPIFTPV